MVQGWALALPRPQGPRAGSNGAVYVRGRGSLEGIVLRSLHYQLLQGTANGWHAGPSFRVLGEAAQHQASGRSTSEAHTRHVTAWPHDCMAGAAPGRQAEGAGQAHVHEAAAPHKTNRKTHANHAAASTNPRSVSWWVWQGNTSPSSSRRTMCLRSTGTGLPMGDCEAQGGLPHLLSNTSHSNTPKLYASDLGDRTNGGHRACHQHNHGQAKGMRTVTTAQRQLDLKKSRLREYLLVQMTESVDEGTKVHAGGEWGRGADFIVSATSPPTPSTVRDRIHLAPNTGKGTQTKHRGVWATCEVHRGKG